MGINSEIKQSAFASEKQKFAINLIFSGAWVYQWKTNTLKPFGLSPNQFNVLRIIRGQKGQPINVKDIASRMIDKSCNVSRIVDSLHVRSLIGKVEDPEDKRLTNIIITQYGLDLLLEASNALDDAIINNLGHLKENDLRLLNHLLDNARSGMPN